MLQVPQQHKIKEGDGAMPVKVKKVDGYQVSHGGKVSAKKTTRAKAQAQANLLRAVEHGWEPTGKPVAKKRAKKK